MSDLPERIPALPREEWTDAAREVFAFWGEPNSWEEGSKTNIIMAMANNPPLATAFNQWGKHLLVDNSIATRQQELVILRVAYRVKSAYEWHNHVGYAIKGGITLDEIAAVRDGASAGNWDDLDRACLALVDELIDTGGVTDALWAQLSGYYSRAQMMDLVFTIGHYVMTSWAITAFGVPIEGGADAIGFDLNTKSGAIPGATFKPREVEDWTSTRGY